MPLFSPGRLLFGSSSLLLGLVGFLHQLGSILGTPFSIKAAFLMAISCALIVGGALIMIRRTAPLGAGILGVAYLLIALTTLPAIVTHPEIYASWGNAFYELALLAGAMVVFSSTTRAEVAKGLCVSAIVLMGLSSISFGIEQLEFFNHTSDLVPKWMPLGGTFWNIFTTVAFGMAGSSLISRRYSRLASRLLTAMVLGFGMLVWVPALIRDPQSNSNWSEGLNTFAVAGAAWLIAEFLNDKSDLERV